MNQETGFIDIWNICNEKCYFCFKDIWVWITSKEEIISAIDNYIRDGIKVINYWVWEFTVHPYFFEILEYWRTLWIEQNVHSNWITLSEMDFVKRIAQLWIKNISISLHSVNDLTNFKITWVKNSLKKTLRWIKNCVDAGFWVSISCVITNDNISEILKIYLISLKLWVRTIKFWLLNSSSKYNVNIIPSIKDVKMVISELILTHNKYSLQNRIHIKFLNIPHCFLWENIDTFIIEDTQSDELNFKWDMCNSCSMRGKCSWIPNYYNGTYLLNEVINPYI